MRPLEGFALLPGALIILFLIGLGVFAVIVGNAAGRVVGAMLLASGVALGAGMVRSFARPS